MKKLTLGALAATIALGAMSPAFAHTYDNALLQTLSFVSGLFNEINKDDARVAEVQARNDAASLNDLLRTLGESFDKQVAQASTAGFTTNELSYYDGHGGVTGSFTSNTLKAY